MVKRIKTNIKFYKGLNNVEGKIYGFVTKVNESWRGCRETTPKKKIVFVDEKISDSIIPNVLYKCSIIPMREKHGFIALSATMVRFNGVVITEYREGRFKVKVAFGNKEIVYDQYSEHECEKSIQRISEYLKKCVDLKNAYEIAEEFVDAACIAKSLNKEKENGKDV